MRLLSWSGQGLTNQFKPAVHQLGQAGRPATLILKKLRLTNQIRPFSPAGALRDYDVTM